MVTVSRGVRISEKQFARIYDIWQAARKDHSIQINQVITVLLELGLAAFPKLSEPLQKELFRERTVKQGVRLRDKLESHVTRIASTLRLDGRLSFALPTPAKELIRDEAHRSHKSMSALARHRIMLAEGTS